jgi:toxin CptA
LLHAGFCGAVLLSSLACDSGLAMAACVVCAAAGWWGGRGSVNASRIDISPVGQVRLTVQQSSERDALPLSLLAGSTLWPGLLVLRLGQPGQPAVQTVLVLPDSVAHASWRPLALACRRELLATD